MAAITLRRFLDNRFDPRDAVCIFLDNAEKHVRSRGIILYIDNNFDRLIEVNKENREHNWFAVMPMFDPSVTALNDWDRGFWMEGRTMDGKTVSSQSARFYNLPMTSLAEKLSSLEFFYDEPEKSKGSTEACSVSAPSARHIRQRVCYSGGTWAHPKFRGKELASLLPRISRSVAMMLWDTDYTISLVDPILIEKGIVRKYGYKRVEAGVEWRGNPGQGDLDLSLVWMDRPEMLTDLASSMAIEVQALA